jgi:hypothetical protein
MMSLMTPKITTLIGYAFAENTQIIVIAQTATPKRPGDVIVALRMTMMTIIGMNIKWASSSPQ